MKAIKVLSISLGTRMMGIAVLENGKFTEWRVKSFKTVWSDKKQQSILLVIKKLISKHSITHLALKLPHITRHFPALSCLAADISTITLRKEIYFRTYNLTNIKNEWIQKGKRNKKYLVAEVSKRYSFLKPEFEKEMKTKHRYYEKLFEAVAMATMMYEDL